MCIRDSSRIWQSVKAALVIYFVWWVFIMAFTFLCGEAAVQMCIRDRHRAERNTAAPPHSR